MPEDRVGENDTGERLVKKGHSVLCEGNSVLTRYDYNVKTLAEILDTKPIEICSFLNGKLTPARSQGITKHAVENWNSVLILYFQLM